MGLRTVNTHSYMHLSERTHRYLVLVTDLGDRGTLLSGLRIRHRNRKLVDVDRRPFRISVSVQILVVGANSVFPKNIPELYNRLY